MLGKKLINAGPVATGGANTFASENFNTVLYTGNGSTQRIGGYINRGAVFNGSANITTSLDFYSLTDYTISMWLFVASAPSNTEFFAGTIQNTSALNGIYLGVETDGDIRFYERNASNSATALVSTDSITFGSWNHIVAVRDGSTNYLYINNGTPVSASNSTITHSTDFTIGRAGAYTTRPVVGKIDQVRIFNKALSSSEVTTLYGETHASTTISTTDIFSDNSGVALYQLDGNANDTGGASGKFGSAAHFDNNTSRSAINVSINLGGIKSISHWVKFDEFQVDNIHMFSSSSNNLQLGILNTSGQRAFFYYDGSATNQFGTSYPNDNNWHHLVWVLNGTSAELYLDGSSIGTATTASTTQTSIVIGTNSLSSGVRGKIDDLRIYSDALTSTEVGYLYNNTTASIPTDNLLAYYKFDGDARDEQQLYDGTASNVSYAYDGTATNVTYQEATKFQPDLVWVKKRDAVHDHKIADSVRGATKIIESSTADAEITATGSINAFHTNGFAVGSDSSVNGNGNDFVAWCFKGGGTAVSNTDGSITSTVSANTDAGFSIATYTATNSTQNVGHGLSATPELVIIKRTSSPAYDWIVYTNVIDSSVDYLILNSTAIKADTTKTLNSTVFTTPSTGDFVAYSFHSVDGYSKIGTYTGTGTTNGNFVETGFEPAFVMVKRTDGGAQNWVMFDNKRSTTNPRTKKLAANLSSDENNSGTIGTDAQDNLDFYADGFRPVTSNNHTNISGGTFIYLAIAADPDTTTPTVEDSFDVVTYTGNGTDITVNTDFKPDMVWIKERTSTSAHRIVDSVRGDKKRIFTNTTDAESTVAAGEIFLENGFQIGADNGSNQNGEDYVAWVWKAGDHDDNLPQINTEGSIDSVVSVNAEAGFSIVKYTGTGTAGATIGHGLSSTPEMIILKNTTDVVNWFVWTKDLGGGDKLLELNTTSATKTTTTPWNSTVPSSTVFTVGTNNGSNGSGDNIIAYCFHSVSGYQKIGSYTGNDSLTGPTVTTGFRPRFVLIKNVDSAGNSWAIIDGTRSTADPRNKTLFPNTNAIEYTNTGGLTFTDTGFEVDSTDNFINGLNNTHIYLAIK